VTIQFAASKFGTGSRQHAAVRDAWRAVGVPQTAPAVTSVPYGESERVDAASAAFASGERAAWANVLRRLAEAIQSPPADPTADVLMATARGQRSALARHDAH
jgi:hypothetical protein